MQYYLQNSATSILSPTQAVPSEILKYGITINQNQQKCLKNAHILLSSVYILRVISYVFLFMPHSARPIPLRIPTFAYPGLVSVFFVAFFAFAESQDNSLKEPPATVG